MFEVGQKVIPITKTRMRSLDESSVWREAQYRGQDYLYFKGEYICEGEFHGYSCTLNDSRYDQTGGDMFNLSDLVPYINEMGIEITSIRGIVSSAVQQHETVSGEVK
jgi:hypothetical protein